MTGSRPSEDVIKVSLKSQAAFERLYKFLACVVLIFVAAPIFHTLVRPTAGKYTTPLTVTVVPVMFCLGYGLQALFGAVMRIKRAPSSRTYEKIEKYFSLPEAALTLALCAVAGFAVSSFVTSLLREGYLLHIGLYYQKASAIPHISGLICAALMAMGVITWFYPYGFLISMRSSFVFLVCTGAVFVFNYAYRQSQTFLLICTVPVIILSLLVINQNQIVTVISAAKTALLTPRVRYYNLISVGIIFLFILLAFPFVLAVIVGLIVLANMILFFLLRNTGQSEELLYADAGEQAAEFGSFVFGRVGGVGPQFSIVLFSVFMVLLLVAIIVLIFIRQRNIIKVIFDFINILFASLMEFLANLFSFNRLSTEKYILSDYRDVETKTEKNAIREYSGKYMHPPRSYRDFLRRLEAIPDARGRLVFAYSELVRCWGEKRNVYLKISDTPAEIEQKVSAVTADTNAEPITRAFEYIKYAERDLPEKEISRLVSLMCAQIQRAYAS